MVQDMMNGDPVDVGGVVDGLLQSYSKVWEQFDQFDSFRVAEAANRKALTYAKCFRPDEEPLSQLPAYFRSSHLSPSEVVRVSRFRVGSHFLRVETDRWSNNAVPWEHRWCSRCVDLDEDYLRSLGVMVDDEHHMLFDCLGTAQHRSAEVREELSKSNHSVRRLIFHGDKSVVCKYISQCMMTVDNNWVASNRATRAQQPAG